MPQPSPSPQDAPPVDSGWQVVHWHAQAPAQPATGAPCNGCGLCCLAQPCPLGMVVSRRRSGACVALRWDAAQQRYHCGMVVDPGSVIGWRNAWVTRALRALAWRWIAAGAGCDAEPLMVETSSQRDAR